MPDALVQPQPVRDPGTIPGHAQQPAKSALAPLLIVWLGNNMRTIIVAAISVALFGSILTLHTGFSQMDGEQVKLIYSLAEAAGMCS